MDRSSRRATKVSRKSATKTRSQKQGTLTEARARLPRINSLLLASLLVNAVLFAVTYRLYTPHFQVNDDVGMMLLSSGTTLSLVPTEYLLFTNIVLGTLLRTMYQLKASVPWYPLYLVGCLLIAHVAILYVIVERNRSLIFVLLYVVYFALCSQFFLTSLQFTMVAAITAIAGIALLLFRSSVDDDEPGARSRLGQFWSNRTIPGIAVLFLSSLVRFDITLQ